jgi:hypothetical protein
VRVTAGEIRKRIAQYYMQPGHEDEIRIEIPLGTYVPEFRFPESRTGVVHAPAILPLPAPPISAQPEPDTPGPLPAREPRTVSRWWMFAAALLIATLSAAGYRFSTSSSPLDEFWESAIASPGPALLCVSVQSDLQNPVDGAETAHPRDPPLQYELDRWMNRVGLSDATAMAQMASVLYSKNKDYRLKGDQSVTLDDLRQGSVVLIGAFNNSWTMRLTRELRFGFAADNVFPGRHWIIDRQRPGASEFQINSETPYKNVDKDYALIAKYQDQSCGCTVIVAGGLGEYGTIAAGEFLSNNKYFREVLSRAPSDWQRQNMEAIVSTTVIDGNSGPPHVVETYFW